MEVGTEGLTAWLNLVQANQAVVGAMELALGEATGLSLAEHEVLVRLADAPEGRLRMLDLTNLIMLTKSGVTRLIDRMEREGLVQRQPCPTDRRVVYPAVTRRGRLMLEKATPVFLAAVERHFSRHLSEADVRSLRRVLRKLLVGNGRWEEARCATAPASAARLVG